MPGKKTRIRHLKKQKKKIHTVSKKNAAINKLVSKRKKSKESSKKLQIIAEKRKQIKEFLNPEEIVETKEDQQVLQDAKEHAKQMKSLKDEQAEFFEFLQQEDAGLLNFGDSFDEDEMDEEDEEKEDTSTVLNDKISITKELLEQWQGEATTNISSCRNLMRAYYNACQITTEEDDDDDDEKKGKKDKKEEKEKKKNKKRDTNWKYQIVSSGIFNDILVYTLTNAMDIFDSQLKRDREKEREGGKYLPNVHTVLWKKINISIRAFVKGSTKLLMGLTESKMVEYVLKGIEKAIDYFFPFPNHLRVLLPKMLELWSKSDEVVRILAFFIIRKIAMYFPYPKISDCLKGSYLKFVKNAKFCNKVTIGIVNFMSNCVVELYGIDFIASYQHAFVYIRQVAIHLRDAYMAKKNRRAVASIYTWQIYHCLKVWVKLLCAYPNQQDLWLLSFPLCQIIHGIIGLVPSPRYYPLRIHYLHLLNELAQSRSQTSKPIFLNSLSYILEMLSYSFFHKNLKPWSGKPEYFAFALKAHDKIIQTYAFYDAIMREVLELLVKYFITYAKSVSFPELALPAIVQLKHFLQTCQPSSYPAKIKQFVEVLENQSKVILSHRNLANFNPADEHKVASFMSKLKQKTPLEIYHQRFLIDLEEQKKLQQQQESAEPEEGEAENDNNKPEEPEEGFEEGDLEEEEDDDQQLKEFNLHEFTEEN